MAEVVKTRRVSKVADRTPITCKTVTSPFLEGLQTAQKGPFVSVARYSARLSASSSLPSCMRYRLRQGCTHVTKKSYGTRLFLVLLPFVTGTYKRYKVVTDKIFCNHGYRSL